MTMVTPPMRVACTMAPSPLSAKNSMNQKITAAEMHSTSHSVTGITPAAPCTRSLRASSRSEVWSSHLP